jgi:hypothetical protein
MADHFIDRHINFRRLFAEAIRDTIIDQFDRSLLRVGYYEIKFHIKLKPGQFVPFVPARIYWRDHEPGLGMEWNKLDRWPLPVLAGEILGEDVDPVLVWTGRDRRPLSAPTGHTLDSWYRYKVADAIWAADHAPEEPIAHPRRPARLTSLPPIGPPDE